MTFTIAKKTLIQYPDATLKRAKRALRCSPFQLKLFTTMIKESVPLTEIATKTGQEQGYTYKVITETTAENQLMWLIKVGILRREVDGQGITDSFRLTPLGRLIISEWETQKDIFTRSSFFDYLLNTLSRWLSWQF
jgi:hypothetical protein